MDDHLFAGMIAVELLSKSQRAELYAKLTHVKVKDKVNSYILNNVLMRWPTAKLDDMLSKFCNYKFLLTMAALQTSI